VAVDGLRGPAKDAALDGRIAFWPARWQKAFVGWLDNLRDWNISRQLWWGHRIPAWYCPDGHVTVAREDPDACGTCGSGTLEQDPDVLDTWFSSQLWPYSTLGWPDDTEDLRFFYPNTALVTGYEILYLWVARMIMSGISLTGDIPYRNAVIHGLVRDGHGRKMSKSLGNVIDPMEMVDRFGADAVRFSLVRSASGGQQDIPLSVESIEGARNFANKIWNAARLVFRAYPGGEPKLPPEERLTISDRWLISRFEACRADVDAAIDAYQFSEATQEVFRFLWSEFCDWGLEMQKGRLDAEGEDRQDAANVLAWVLERTLRLLHPVMPFVTEEIWQRFGIGPSISIASWPEQRPDDRDVDAEAAFALVQDIVSAVRQFRSRHGISPSVKFEALAAVPAWGRASVGSLEERIQRLAGVTPFTIVDPLADKPPGWIALTLADGFVHLPPGLFDVEGEAARLTKQRDEIATLLTRSTAKLANEGFLAKAADDVVTSEREKQAKLTQQLAELGG
jgi:valyl-tRNA synthetase